VNACCIKSALMDFFIELLSDFCESLHLMCGIKCRFIHRIDGRCLRGIGLSCFWVINLSN